MAMLIYRRVVKNIESTTEIGQASMVSLWYQGWFTDVENWIDSWDKSALNPTCHFDPVQNYDTNGTTKASLLGSGFAVTCDLVLEQQKKHIIPQIGQMMEQQRLQISVKTWSWLVVEPPSPLKNDGVKVSWDDDIPNRWKVIRFMFQTTNQWSHRVSVFVWPRSSIWSSWPRITMPSFKEGHDHPCPLPVLVCQSSFPCWLNL